MFSTKNKAHKDQAPPHLGPEISKRAISKHRSLNEASERINVPYERLRKSIYRNNFRMDDLRKLLVFFPGESVQTLKHRYAFTVHEPQSRTTAHDMRADRRAAAFEMILQKYSKGNLRLGGDISVSNAVDEMYQFLQPSDSAFIFFQDSQPIEWDVYGRNDRLLVRMVDLIRRGISVYYLTSLPGRKINGETLYRRPTECIDRIEEDFFAFAKAVTDEADRVTRPGTTSSQGNLVLLWVRDCAFLSPHQKWRFFNLVEAAEELTLPDAPQSCSISRFAVLTTPLAIEPYRAKRSIDTHSLRSPPQHDLVVPQNRLVTGAIFRYLRMSLLGRIKALQSGLINARSLDLELLPRVFNSSIAITVPGENIEDHVRRMLHAIDESLRM